MKIQQLISRAFLLGLTPFVLSACVNSVPFSVGTDSASFDQEARGGVSNGSLASLLTGSVVSEEEAQLRDTLKREIVLDFPIRVGVVFFQFNSLLDDPDREEFFDGLKNHLEASELVHETVQIPSSLVNNNANLEQLRQIAARFQTDILVLVNATHDFARAREQNLSFWDSFSDKAYYESKVKYEAIALDVFTGTLLSPFDAAVSGERVLLDFLEPNIAQQRYAYQKAVEAEAWGLLQEEAQKRLENLAQDVEKRKAELAAQPPAETENETDNTEGTNNG